MSDSKPSAQDKPVKAPGFSYAKAAQGRSTQPAATAATSGTTTPAASAAGNANGKQQAPAPASQSGSTTPASATTTNKPKAGPAADNAAAAAPATAAKTEIPSAQSQNSSHTSTTPATAGVHMPPRGPAQERTGTAPEVQFGNFTNPSTPQPASPGKNKPIATGGAAPPARPAQQKDAPQFGSFDQNENKPLHSRTNSESSEFRPSGMPNYSNPQQQHQGGYFAGGQPSPNYGGYGPGGYNPNMPGSFRGGPGGQQGGGGRGGMHQYGNPRHHTPGRPSQTGGNVASPRAGGVGSPITTPQQAHAQMAMGSPMGSPMFNGYAQMHGPGMYGYPNYGPQFGGQGYPGYPGGPMQQQHSGQQGQPGQYMNQQGRPMQFGTPGQGQSGGGPHPNQSAGGNTGTSSGNNQYQNPALQSPMPRTTSGLSERSNAGTPQQSAPIFTTPRKSAAIKIVRPDNKTEVLYKKAESKANPAAASTPSAAATPSAATAASPAPVKAQLVQPQTQAKQEAATIPAERPTSSSAGTASGVAETPEQKKAKQDAARQAVLDKVNAARAAEEQSKNQAAAAATAASQKKEAEDKAQEATAVAEREKKEEEATEAKAKVEADAAAAKAKAEEDEKVKAEAEAKQAKAKAEAEAADKAKADKADADAEANEKAVKEAESAEESKATEPTAASSGTLDTIAEPAGADQKRDVVETKPVEEDSAKDLTIDTSDKPAEAKPSRMLECLEKAKKIENLKDVTYPSGIKAPLATLNTNATGGRFKYDREFLLQFQKVYTDKPMSNWDERLNETIGDVDSRSGKTGMGGRSGSNRTPTAGSPFGGSGLPALNPKPLGSSAARFAQSQKMLSQGIDPKIALGTQPFERGATFKPGMARTNTLPPPRADSKRGGKSGPPGAGGRQPSNRPDKNQIGAPTIAPEDVKPLPMTGNRWQPKRGAAEAEPLPGGEDAQMAPEMVQRKVKGLLNKLTVDNFDRISDQILVIASQSKNETDGRTLRQVIALTFEKATDEAHFSEMYARFCRKMMESMDPSISDDNLKDKSGDPVTGGVLFRKYLLTRCQEDFERGWKSQLPPKPEGEAQTEEAAMLSDEYYIEAAAKRRGLGLVRFVGEVYKLGMLNEKIMHQIIVKLLSNVVNPEEDEVESLTKLVTTVGKSFDESDRGSNFMDAYVTRMEQMSKNTSLSSRHRFMIMDVLDLRKANWEGGADTKGPKKIQEIHEEAAKAAAAKEASRGPSHRGPPGGGGGGRPDFGRGDARTLSRRNESHGPSTVQGPDGWTSVRAAGDLASFGKFTDRTASKQGAFGPGGNLSQQSRNPVSGRSAVGSRNPSHAGTTREESRTAAQQQPANAFAVLQGDDGEPKEEEESGAGATEESSGGRPKLNLLPKGATAGEDQDGEATPTDDGANRPKLNLMPKGATDGKEPVMAPKSADEDEADEADEPETPAEEADAAEHDE